MGRGRLALIVYILNTVFFGGMALLFYLVAINNQDAGFENLGLVILMVISLALFAVYALMLIIKVFHLLTGWKLFPILCLLINLVVIFYLGYVMYDLLVSGVWSFKALIVLAALILSPTVSLLAEAKSLGN